MTSVIVIPENIESFSNVRPSTTGFLPEEPSIKPLDTEDDFLIVENHSTTWRTNIFTLYARVFRIMLAKWKERIERAEECEKSRVLDDLILPSNEEWRYQVYYRLVDLQREIDHGTAAETTEMKEPEPEVEAKEPKEWDWEPGMRDFPLRPKSGNIEASLASLAAINDTSGSMTEACIEPGWRVKDILLAAQVLQGESLAPTYKDEAEMRRVFGLVYDVLRYKQILNQALHDVGFWYQYSEYKDREKIVWLLLYDMQGRKFSRRGDVAVVELREQAFCDAGLKEIEDALLETKTRLAASVSRLRIGGSALTLDELLPDHLRTAEGVTWGEDGAIASGWVNTMKISSKAEFVGEMAKLQLRLCIGCGETELDEDHYVFDPLCPKVVNLHDKAREKLAISDLVTSHRFVFLERSLCQGAAALAQAVRSGRLCGPVVLTHSIAPRHTAYLAGLLADIEDAGRLLAFGTGDRRSEYEQYLGKLGVTIQQCRVFSERYVSPPPLAELERATVVLATPPCSYTGIKDVVDLAVARGGDTRLLETLTNIDVELEQPKALLTEQLTTLKYALTRPNVQLLLYEAHSILPSETFEMVEQVTQYANQIAVEKYARDHPPKRKLQSKESATKVSRSSKSGKRSQSQDHKKDQQEDRRIDEEEEEAAGVSTEIVVPDSDLFEIGAPTDLYGRESAQLFNEGCYLAVIKRKEMMQFNSLFMIKVAESKGLFGDPTKQQQQQPKEEHIASPVRQESQSSRKKGFKRAKIQMDRITAPTHSSMVRSSSAIKQEKDQRKACPKHSHRIAKDERLTNAQPTPSKPSRVSNVSSTPGELRSRRNSRQNSKLIRSKPSKRSHRKDSAIIWITNDDEMNLLPSLSVQNATNATFSVDKNSSPSRSRFILEPDAWISKYKDYKNSSTFSFAHGTWALAHATQKISLKNILDEDDKENLWQFRLSHQSTSSPVRKLSHFYHPEESLAFISSLENSYNPLTTNLEHVDDFPYLFPGTGNAAAEAGLDNSSKI